MSLRLEMLQVARLAPKLLDDSTSLVTDFFLSRHKPDGGFPDRTGKSDLYYTVFGLEGLLALQVQPDLGRVRSYLGSFDSGDSLDFVHLCCLARGWAALRNLDGNQSCPAAHASRIVERLREFRSRDGGYSPVPGAANGTAYASFLAFGAHQDLGATLPDPLRLVQCLKLLETRDNAWANERGVPVGSTNATAAAITLLRHLNAPMNSAVGEWLLARAHPQGGFLAMPKAPLPDLLSTATTLHALSGLQVSFESHKERCLDFIDTLWTSDGGFHGQWADDHLDCEYTYYGLLALGHLSL
jgi:prenyltransferase beta subunit